MEDAENTAVAHEEKNKLYAVQYNSRHPSLYLEIVDVALNKHLDTL